MKNHSPVVLLLIFILLAGPFLLESTAQEPADFDRDGNGMLNRSELTIFFIHRLDPSFSKLDMDKDGIITDAEMQKARAEMQKFRDEAMNFNVQDVIDFFGEKEAYPVEEIRDYTQTNSRADRFTLGGIQIRNSHEIVSYQRANPAHFSYTRDFETDSDVWQAQGTVLRPIKLYAGGGDADPDSIAISAINLVPSISFDRVSSEGSLVFRLGGDLELFGGWLDLQNLRLYASYATDFDFRSDIIAAEFEWEPTLFDIGIGVYRSLIRNKESIEYRFRAFLHGEYGRVNDTGEKTALEDADFFRVGPFLQVEIRPEFFRRFTLRGAWTYQAAIDGLPKNSYLSEVAANCRLDQYGHFSVEMVYQNGRIPFTQDEVETLTIGLGIKF